MKVNISKSGFLAVDCKFSTEDFLRYDWLRKQIEFKSPVNQVAM